jgi:hypothetical protein
MLPLAAGVVGVAGVAGVSSARDGRAVAFGGAAFCVVAALPARAPRRSLCVKRVLEYLRGL